MAHPQGHGHSHGGIPDQPPVEVVPAGALAEIRDVSDLVLASQASCLNHDPKTSISSILKADGVLKSDEDTDHQLLLNIPFNDTVKLQSVVFKANTDTLSAESKDSGNASGPLQIKLFVDKPNLDFAEADNTPPTQILALSEADLNGKKVLLKFVKFQNVHSVQMLILSNQGDSDVTFLNRITFYGVPIHGTDMKALKKIGDDDH